MRLIKAQTRQKPRQKFEYTLPDDEIQVMACALALGYLAALRDFPITTVLCREAIEEQARSGCERLKTLTSAQHLTNDFDAFLTLFREHYARIYQESRAKWQLDQKLYRADRAALQDMDWKLSYQCMYAHFYHLARHIQDMEAEIRAKILVELQQHQPQ